MHVAWSILTPHVVLLLVLPRAYSAVRVQQNTAVLLLSAQFYEHVVLRNLRPLLPADYVLLMQHCFLVLPTAYSAVVFLQFYEHVVLRNLRPLLPAGVPADYSLLMQHCWASDPASRPNVDRWAFVF
jgi:hypothetical protein